MSLVRKSEISANPKWHWMLLLVVVAFEYLRPTEGLLKFLAPLRLAGLAAVAMIVVFVSSDKSYIKSEKLHKLVLVFWFLIALSTFYATNNRVAFNTMLTFFWMIFGFIFPLNAVLDSKEKIYRFFFYWIVIQVVLGVLVITGGGHGPGSFLWDENDVALVLNMAVPYAIYLPLFPGVSKKMEVRAVLFGSASSRSGRCDRIARWCSRTGRGSHGRHPHVTQADSEWVDSGCYWFGGAYHAGEVPAFLIHARHGRHG